ncbi:disintegrin and metalloproteinase domain-containing protein 2-like isoform X2 [Paroedura picta]|uniref:disintegrin and metalloproteinase domain-containing protein 2-like isoform X2 n=1 Tax=Paroedura picta TaxID=143630 RepID=UPI004055E681
MAVPGWALPLRLLLLAVSLPPALGFQRKFMEVIIPQRIPLHASGNLDRVTFILTMDGKSYTVHLKQQSILSNDFRIYKHDGRGTPKSVLPSIKRDCYYQGYVADYIDSIVMLSTCSGLRGLLQFPNTTYGIEPMESAHGFQHLIYQLNYENSSFSISTENYHIKWNTALIQKINIGVPANFSTQRYLEIHIVVAKALYEFLGSKEEIVTEKIIQLMNFVSAMFFKLNTKIILSSLEFWTDKDRIHTSRNMNELLQRFTEWKHSHLSLRPHDIVFLFIYTDQSNSVGSTFARKLCVRATSAAVAVYKKGYTLENFSVVVAQLLAISLGIYFDQSRNCHCPGTVCLMHTRAVQASGVKAFSSCSVKDFQSFLAHGQGQCLLNKPRLDLQYRTPSCGNGIVEDGEQCDCGSNQQCMRNGCCNTDCRLRPGKACAHGSCCWEGRCRIKEKGVMCRDARDPDCDLKEYCNGSSAECTEDFYVQDGQLCESNTGVCMSGLCQSSDRWCRKVFGKDSKSGPTQCYEEINSQTDRMGHCGNTPRGYENCQWQDLRCGKLICEYPHNRPFLIDGAAVIYARVQNRWCVTLDYQKGLSVRDPFLVHDGAGCGQNKYCMNQKCVEYSTMKPSCNAETKCNNKGVCNNKGNCHCHSGWAPPDCRTREVRGFGGSIDSNIRRGSTGVKPRTISTTTRNWLLVSFLLFLPLLITSTILIVKVRVFLLWRREEEAKREEEVEEEEEYEEASV